MRKAISTGNIDRKKHSDKFGFKTVGPSLTVQAQKEEADINTIVRNFGVTGKLPQGVKVPSYGDFEGVSDYRSALEAVAEAEASFMAMPAEVRSRFENDPQQFLEFCADSSNLEEMRKLGLAPAPVVPSGSEAS